MVPERIGFELTRLPDWQVLFTATRQTLSRTCWFATYADAVFFIGAASAVCEGLSLFPRLDIEPMGPEGAPTRVQVAISAAALDDEHFQLAHAINATHAALVVDASGTLPADVATHTGPANTANTV